MARFLLISAWLALLLSGCGDSAAQKEIRMNDKKTTVLAAKMQLVLPPNAVILGIRETNGLDNSAFLKVQFDKDQWDQFLDASPLRSEEFSDERRYLLGPNDGWWDPERPKVLPTAQAHLAEGKVLNMGVDQSDTSKVVVYLMWHET
ncbi:MAG: hypothetical protein KKC76_18875 [Proteobacteria bacterium]|nr:hypothetical protein [Pseudomonadota bacterium]MBU4296510.1 hypothetical protein [Pseudomonadota bacterium]MCG2746891.1 hypothetical protein [Desulfobulbaceae bacterium]